jgi:flagellar biosynthesis/type III secretory pathway chaperone
MSEPDSANTRLIALLRTEARAFEAFASTLQAEQESLVKNDIETLTALAQTKQQQIDRLNQLADQRLQAIAQLGHPRNRAGMEAWALQAGRDAVEAWQAVLQSAAEVHRINRINGDLIDTHLQRNRQALHAVLRASGHASLYGPDGQPDAIPGGGTSRGIIGKA